MNCRTTLAAAGIEESVQVTAIGVSAELPPAVQLLHGSGGAVGSGTALTRTQSAAERLARHHSAQERARIEAVRLPFLPAVAPRPLSTLIGRLGTYRHENTKWPSS